MKDFFQRLKDLLGLNDSPVQLEDIPQTPEMHNHHHSEIKPEVQVRTRSVYPREHQGTARFRFPVIPDDRASKLVERKVRDELPKESKPVIHESTTPKPSAAFKTEKKGFKPSEMISPVYGMKRPTTQQWQEEMDVQVVPQEESSKSGRQIKVENAEATRFSSIMDPVPLPEEVKVLIHHVTNEKISSSSLPDVPIVQKETVRLEEPITPVDMVEPIAPPTTTTAKVIAFPRKHKEQEPSQHTPKEVKLNQPTIPTLVKIDPYHEPVSGTNQTSNLPSRRESGLESGHQTGLYRFPQIEMLREEPRIPETDLNFVDNQIDKLTNALENFNVSAEVVGVVKGPTVTRYELQPAPGVKVNKFTNLIDDIKLALAAKDIRMEAPIPGRSAIGIEVPNEVSSPVFIRSIIESEEFQQHPSPLAVALGRDIGGAPVIGDLKKMPHGLIAGSTGSGKSVCINSILVSLLYKAKPSEVRLILIDPKVVELAPYNHIPHLLTPVVTDPKQATAALKWAVEEMEKRYERFADLGVRDIDRYNTVAVQDGNEKLPYIIIVIDELADLMMVSPHDVEESICRIAQKARACGIHLLLATQRPSVDVITGLIKANIPTRVAFAVSSQVDSRTILDMGGAERLLGKGDMLYYPSGLAKPVRLQGNFVSDDEIETVVDHVKGQQQVKYLIDKEELNRSSNVNGDCDDELFSEAVIFTIEQGQASSSSLQRRFRIGYNRAARLIDMMESEGFISGQSGSKPRDVLITLEEYQQIFSGIR